MQQIRYSTYAGTFYPSSKQHINTLLDYYIGQAHALPAITQAPKAIIAPHAAYLYSGCVAGSAYSYLQAPNLNFKRVILLAPAHKNYFDGMCVAHYDAFETPCGVMQVDQQHIKHILANHSQCFVNNHFHTEEYALEVQLPFLQRTLKNIQLVPILVGNTSPETIAELLDNYLLDPKTLVVISSDLSHFLSNNHAIKTDQYSSRCIEQWDMTQINSFHACGYLAIKGLALLAQSHSLTATAIDVRNSYQVTGQKPERVVGYGAYIIQ